MNNVEIQQSLINAKLIIADLTMQLYEARGANFNLDQQLAERDQQIAKLSKKEKPKKGKNVG